MEQFGFHGLWNEHLKRFVRAFPMLVLRDPFTRPDDLSSHEHH
jgi:hypothetical protein